MRVALFIAAFISTLFAVPSVNRAATEIPFKYKEGMIWLEVRVAGQPAPLKFVLDSGAGSTVLDMQTARRLGLKFGRREKVQGVEGSCAAFRISGLDGRVEAVPIARSVLALDLRPVSSGCGNRIDGLLGAEFFQGRIVEIDFEAQKIRLLERGDIPEGAEAIPLCKRDNILCVRVAVNHNPHQWMRLDTGCSSSLEWASGRAATRGPARTSIATATGTSRTIQADVALGSERFAAVNIGLHDEPMFSGEAGLFGNGLLSKFRVIVDAAKSQLYLSRIK